MPEPRNVPMVSPNGRYEILQEKLDKFKEHNLSARELQELNQAEDRFASQFVEYCWKILGISDRQISELEEADIVCLAESVIEKKVRQRRYWAWFIICSNPIGWIWLLSSIIVHEGMDSIRYFKILKRLRSAYGQNYFPAKKILEVSKER